MKGILLRLRCNFLLRLLGPILTTFLKFFVMEGWILYKLGSIIVFSMETLEMSAWQLEVNSIVVVFLLEFFTLDILRFGLITWAFVGMVVTGVRVHSSSGMCFKLSCFHNNS